MNSDLEIKTNTFYQWLETKSKMSTILNLRSLATQDLVHKTITSQDWRQVYIASLADEVKLKEKQMLTRLKKTKKIRKYDVNQLLTEEVKRSNRCLFSTL